MSKNTKYIKKCIAQNDNAENFLQPLSKMLVCRAHHCADYDVVCHYVWLCPHCDEKDHLHSVRCRQALELSYRAGIFHACKKYCITPRDLKDYLKALLKELPDVK